MSALFTEAVANRTISFPLRLSLEEREFIREEADRRGVNPTTLMRQCLREVLLLKKQS